MEPERSASAAAQSAEDFHSRTFLMVSIHHACELVDISDLFSFNVLLEGKAVLSIGPFVVVEDVETKPEPLPGAPEASDADSMQADASAAVEWTVSDSAMSRNEFAGTSGDVVVVSRDPAATLALWLPGQPKDGLEPAQDSKEQVKGSHKLENDLLEVRNSVQKRESGNPQTRRSGESPVKIWQAMFGAFGKDSAADAGPPLPPETDVPNTAKLGRRRAGPVLRSKLEFSKKTDGSQTLSYEEELARTDEDDGSSDCEMKNRGRQDIRATFLDFIRYVHRFGLKQIHLSDGDVVAFFLRRLSKAE